jgi:hypothetical protein
MKNTLTESARAEQRALITECIQLGQRLNRFGDNAPGLQAKLAYSAVVRLMEFANTLQP